FGAVVSFEVAGSPFDAEAVVNALRLFTVAPSLGGVESLATLPVAASHVGVSPEERAKMGIKPETVRLAIGIEDPEDLVADLAQALERVPRPAG
ncbi:MAG: PLP-dependent transferase, partial [Planctomycetales bacterium]|nr:PLP-dependent transferase [Planctomycetales bacterium]